MIRVKIQCKSSFKHILSQNLVLKIIWISSGVQLFIVILVMFQSVIYFVAKENT